MNDHDSPVDPSSSIPSDVSIVQVMPIWKEVLLWIAVFPGAILGSTIVYWVLILIAHLVSFMRDDNTWSGIDVIFINYFSGGACVYCAMLIAPCGKIAVAVTFASLLAFFSVITFFEPFYTPELEWVSRLGEICYDAGAISAAVFFAKQG